MNPSKQSPIGAATSSHPAPPSVAVHTPTAPVNATPIAMRGLNLQPPYGTTMRTNVRGGMDFYYDISNAMNVREWLVNLVQQVDDQLNAALTAQRMAEEHAREARQAPFRNPLADIDAQIADLQAKREEMHRVAANPPPAHMLQPAPQPQPQLYSPTPVPPAPAVHIPAPVQGNAEPLPPPPIYSNGQAPPLGVPMINANGSQCITIADSD